MHENIIAEIEKHQQRLYFDVLYRNTLEAFLLT
jgi:hypothetical protein